MKLIRILNKDFSGIEKNGHIDRQTDFMHQALMEQYFKYRRESK
jgi:hypothetical protein